MRKTLYIIVVIMTVLPFGISILANGNFDCNVTVDSVSAICKSNESTTATVEFEITNRTETKTELNPCIAIYTEDNKPFSVEIVSKIIEAGAREVFCAQIAVPENKTGIYGKIFVWNMETLQPLTEAKSFSIKYGEEKIENGIKYYFDIKDNDFLTSENLQNMCAYSIDFFGDIEIFNGIQVGKGENKYQGGSVAVDNTYVKVFTGTSQTPAYTYEHGLTVFNYISIKMRVDYSARMILEIETNGGKYTKAIPWDVRYGELFVRSLGENTLNNCYLSYACYGLAKDTYIYGDSYLGLYKDKWSKYLIDNNYKNVMLNGYSGRGSKEALNSLKVDLKYGKPKRIIWAMGMNDGDRGAINSVWKSSVEKVMTICNENKIELILCTIPNVPTVDNKYKNDYVEKSGYRFIDFASAVGAKNGAIWYSGTLSNDGIHTTEQGALRLYEQALSDVPELKLK